MLNLTLDNLQEASSLQMDKIGMSGRRAGSTSLRCSNPQNSGINLQLEPLLETLDGRLKITKRYFEES